MAIASDHDRILGASAQTERWAGRMVSRCDETQTRLAERKQALITAAVTGQLDLAGEIAEEAS